MSFIPGIVGGLLGMFGQNQANRSAQQNQQNQYQQSGRDIWNNAQQTEQLLQNLFGGGKLQMPNNAGPQSFGGGIMGNGGQFMQPQGGQQGQPQLPPQLMQMLMSMMNQGGNQGQQGPGQMQTPITTQPGPQRPMQPPMQGGPIGNQSFTNLGPIQGGQNPINFSTQGKRVMF